MSFTYTALGAKQRNQMCEQRILALEADHFGHELNKRSAETLDDSDPGKAAAIEQANSAQATIEAAILACRESLT